MRTNRYAGKCIKCGGEVGAEQGELVKTDDGRWGAQHHPECPKEGDAPPPKAETPKVTFPPTAEQQRCVDLARTGRSFVVKAGAGAGKTSTLQLIAEALSTRQVLYVAYNKAIVKDVSGKMPRNVRAATAHSLAWQAGGKRFKGRLDKGRQRRREIAARLGIDAPMAFKQDDGSPPKMLSPEQLAGVVMQAVGKFCTTADDRPSRDHFPYVEKIDLVVNGVRRWENNNLLRAEMEPVLERAWADVLDPDGWLRYTHDYYLKLWQLSHPRLNFDVVMLDEAQDANPVIASIVEDQVHAQRVLVGDENQQIYEWNGAVDAMKNFDIPDSAMLTKSFRFGPEIARVANETLALLAVPTDMRIEGHAPILSVVGPLRDANGHRQAILCRTNARAIQEVMDALGHGQRPFLVGGGKDIATFARAAIDLQEGRSTDHPELSCFDSWDQVTAFVQQDPQGEELRLLVKLMDDFSPQAILAALNDMADERGADTIVSTAHKAKGREWDRVRIASDFLPKDPNQEPSDADIRLRYVAVTRAKLHLDDTALHRGGAS